MIHVTILDVLIAIPNYFFTNSQIQGLNKPILAALQ